MGYSPEAANIAGAEPDWVYTPIFLCNLSIYCHAFSSPIICISSDTVKYPVPEEAGLGIDIRPLYSGFIKSS